METIINLIPGTDVSKSLSPHYLAQDFGPRSAIAKQCVAKLSDILEAGHPALADWKRRFGRILGTDPQRLEKALHACARKMGALCENFRPDAFFFALQTYYAMLLQLLIRRFPRLEKIDLSEQPFSSDLWAGDAELSGVLKQLSPAMQKYSPPHVAENTASSHLSQAECDPSSSGDLLKALYQELFPRPLRHRLGEYYTPDWLARHVLDQVKYDGGSNQRLLDPACGSGTFLLTAIRRIRAARLSSRPGPWDDSSKADLCRHILSHVAGIDLNPLAVMTARANYLIAIHDLLPPLDSTEPVDLSQIPIYLGDSILDQPPHEALGRRQFDLVVGNPPWIAWDNLPADYRQATKPLWEHYGLFSLSGNQARHGGGKKDLSMLMLYAVADRHLKSGGRLGFVITQTLFQTKGAGDGFRRFRLGSQGEFLKIIRVDDLTAARPFEDAANWTSAIVLEKGPATEYPVPYFKWRMSPLPTNRPCSAWCPSVPGEGQGKGNPISPLPLGEGQGEGSQNLIASRFLARPIDPKNPASPWLLQPQGLSLKMEELIGPSDYIAHLGANTGGANGVYWLELLGRANGSVRVRNFIKKAKTDVDSIETVIEPDLLYPLLRWRNVARYSARPDLYILLAQDCSTRTGIDETSMREKYPRTLEYLKRFESHLCARAAYRRYQHGRPFYSMYNVGPYTTAPIKVVWRRMDRRMNAAVVSCVDDPILGPRPLIPQETCVLIACDSRDEAHYLCAVLNSSLVNYLVQAHSVQGGKSFGTPNMLEYLYLRRFDPLNALHQELAYCSQMAHQNMCPKIESKIDRLVAELCGCNADEISSYFTTAEGMLGL